MAHVDADRNLLFGLLALQNNFIDRDALLDAFSRWVHDRAVPLGQILRDRGALKSDEHDLLQALVAKHLEKFGGDLEVSLRHLSSISSVREDLARIADADLQASLAHVSAARPGDDPYRTLSQLSLGESTSIGGRFRVLRPHAKGGLGQVSVALDQELDRPVALKEIQDRHADDPHSRARFVQEAEITGKLEHPGIIPVYGLGHDATGRPFYAMRFIQGDSLKEAIAAFHGDEGLKTDPVARTSRLRELLRRFTDVCNAVAYAHSRGVLHRDLKPGNIMLGPYGETLVVDWGLAKPVGDVLSGEGVSGEGTSLMERPIRLSGQSGARAETVAGSPIGTPAYASPEQVTGARDRLGPASDVYGLGATLYALLTGHAPVESNELGEVIRRVERGEIPPPRSIDPTIPHPLEAICRKAMATNPEDRYASARALALDVTRWLDDEPVTAYREPVSVRASRWMRRNRTAVAGAAVALVVGTIGLSTVAVVQSRAKSALEAKNLLLTAANAATTQEKNKAEAALDETKRAKKATEEALAQSEESRKRAEAVLTFLKDDVLAAARPEGQRGGLGRGVTIRAAIDAAEPTIAGAFRDQPSVEASIRQALGGTYLDLGELALAIRQLERAVSLRSDRLGPDHPDTLESRNDLALAHAFAGQYVEAIRLFEATLRAREAKLGPDHPDTLTSRNNLAMAYGAVGRYDEEMRLHEAVLRASEAKLGPDHPDTLTSRNNLALAYRKAGRHDEAIRLHEATLRARETKLGPDHPDTLTSRNNLAMAYGAVGRYDEAIRLHEATWRAREAKLGPDHPDTLGSGNNLALAYRAAGRRDEAIRLFEATLRASEAKLGPDHPDTLISRDNLAAAYRAAGRRDEAIRLHEAVLRASEAKLGPDHPDTLISRNNLALSYESVGRWADAEPLRRDALARRRRAENPASPRLAADLAGLGSDLLEQAKWSEAEPFLRECLAIRAKALPDTWLRFHAMSLLGEALMGQGRYAEAEPLIVPGFQEMRARSSSIPEQSRVRLLSEAAGRVVRLYEAWGKPAEAAAWKLRLGLADLPADVFARP
jgi:serine/threonine protein kinase